MLNFYILKLTRLHPHSFAELGVDVEQADGADFELEGGGGVQVGHDELRLAGVGESWELGHRHRHFDAVHFLVVDLERFSVNLVLCRTCKKLMMVKFDRC